MAASEFGSAQGEGFPSLWDRLVDDLPDLVDQIAGIRGELERTLGEERFGAVTAALARSADLPADLGEAAKALVSRLRLLEARRQVVERRGPNLGAQQLRECIRRDIETLFNTERHEVEFFIAGTQRAAIDDEDPDPRVLSAARRGARGSALDAWPEVRTSVVNYGLRPFSGLTASDFGSEAVADEIRRAIVTFEPRVRPDTLEVRVDAPRKGSISVEIEAELAVAAADDDPLHLKASVDLESGQARTVKER